MTRNLLLAALVLMACVVVGRAAETPDKAKPAPDAKAKEPAKAPAADEPLALMLGNDRTIGPVPVGRKIEVQVGVFNNQSIPDTGVITEIKGDAVKAAGEKKTVPDPPERWPGLKAGQRATVIFPLEAVKPGKAEVTFVLGLLQLDAKGKPLASSISRTVVLTIEVQAADAPMPLVVTLGGKDAQAVGPVPVGRKIQVRTRANGSIPGGWDIKEIKGDAVRADKVRYEPDLPGPGPTMVGRAGATLIFPFEAVKAGKAEVTFANNFTVVLTIEVQAADAPKPAVTKT